MCESDFGEDLNHAYSPIPNIDGDGSDSDDDIEGYLVDGNLYRFPPSWDPILGQWAERVNMEAVHIVPLSVGEMEYAHLIGATVPSKEAGEAIWSDKNGIMLNYCLKCALEDCSIVIVADGSTGDLPEYKIVVLSEVSRKQEISAAPILMDNESGQVRNTRLGDLDRRRLKWLNDNRPSPTNLYIRCILTRLCRKKCSVKGWEHDVDKIPPGREWVGMDPLNHGMLRALAEQMGDGISQSTSQGSGNLIVIEDILGTPCTQSSPGCIECSKRDVHFGSRMAENFTMSIEDMMSRFVMG